MENNRVYLSIGSNVGDKLAHLEFGCAQIKLHADCFLIKSSIYLTDPWGNIVQDDFYNQVISFSTHKTPQELFEIISGIESDAGRIRTFKNAPRTLDIDILFYGNKIINNKNIIIPHPRLHLRNFVLIPMAEIAAEFIHPVFSKSIKELLISTKDKTAVSKLKYHAVKSK